MKHFKEAYTWTPNDWNTTIKMYSDAQALVEGFNNFYKTDRPIDVTLMQCIQQHSNDPNVENISSLKIILRENISSGAATMDIGMRRSFSEYACFYALELDSY